MSAANHEFPLAGARAIRFAVAAACVVLWSGGAAAVPIAADGFDYPVGDLVGQNGGTGDWKAAWSGDAEIDILLGTYSYTDSLGNALVVSGNHIEIQADVGSAKKAERQLNSKLGTVASTVWMSGIFDGTASSQIHNLSLGDGLYFGQGDKSTGGVTWQLSDQDGLVGDTGLSAANRAFLVVRIDFTAGDETVWLWVDPDLSATPTVGTAAASGTAKSFEADFIRVQLQSPGVAGFDQVRAGTTYADVAPFVPVPEPNTCLLVLTGLLGLAGAGRRLR